MRKLPKQPNQRLLAFLQADRQWPRAHRIAHARYCLRLQPNSEFWKAVLAANGVKPNGRIEPSTRWSMGDHDQRTGDKPKLSYGEFLIKEGYRHERAQGK